MKTIMHADNWVEIPAGECLLGISDEQAMHIWRQMYDRGNYANLSEADKQRIAEIIDLLRNNRYTVAAHDDGERLFGTAVIPRFAYIPQRRVWLDRFYIARYPITGKQLAAYLGKKVAAQALPDPLEPSQASNGKIYRPDVMSISDTTLALRLCDALGGRLPTADEWEKAARGTEGQLYPWGDEWDETRGAFYRGVKRKYPDWVVDNERSIELYPDNLSPYGVWGQVGGLPEMVVVSNPRFTWSMLDWNGRQYALGYKGSHPKESSREGAFFDHLPARPGGGDWVSMRPVLDVWPQTQWQGVDVSETDAGSVQEPSS